MPLFSLLEPYTSEFSKQYRRRLERALPLENAIYNMVDINVPANGWYMKWLCPMSLPLTCVFSSDGSLVDLIPGATKESFLYTKEALLKGNRTNFHYVNRFNKKKDKLIPLLNQTLKCKIGLDQGVFMELNDSANVLYPYSYYLRILGKMMDNDTVNARLIAEDMVKLENPYYLSLYRDEFITAKKILNPGFDASNDPNIRVHKNVITLPDHKIGETVPFNITIYNDGEQPLKVFDIFKSCTCLKLNGANTFTIFPKDSVNVNFTFEADQLGEVYRDIFIASNAINAPILYVKTLANVIE